MKGKNVLKPIVFSALFFTSCPLYAMQIPEGLLPVTWSAVWFISCLPFWVIGIIQIKKDLSGKEDSKLIFKLSLGYAFLLSAFKIPSCVNGCFSYPSGLALGSVMFGPAQMTAAGSFVILFKFLLTAQGGITTLGANIFSAAIAGPFAAYGIYKVLKNTNVRLAVFLAAFFGDLAAYSVSALQIAFAHAPAEAAAFNLALLNLLSVFTAAEIPAALLEGLLTILAFDFIMHGKKEGVLNAEQIA